MPVIGISSCRALADYLEAVRRAGGEPRVLDAVHARPDEIIREIRGLMLTGGSDPDPALYGEPPHPSVHDVVRERDDFEMDLARRALAADLPVLAICRGIQILNVTFGGTLVQDIPSQISGALDHRVPEPRFAIAHDVWVTRGTRLWNVMHERLDQEDACPVNSRHHQAVARVADGFIVSATAPDGVIEAIERTVPGFCVGVQWHPENFWRTGEFRPLFEALVAACEQQA